MYQEEFSVLNVNEILKNKFKNCVCEDSLIKVINNFKEEYNSLRYGVGIRLYNPVIIQLKGNDTIDFLHRISTNDLRNLKAFEKINTLFLNEKGRFIDRATLLNLNNYFVLIGLQDNSKKLFNWINKYIITEEIETTDITSSYILVEIIGPQTESFLTMILNEQSNEMNNLYNSLNENKVLSISNDNLKYDLFLHKENGLNIYKILLEKNVLGNFIDYILENKSIFDLNFIGEDAYQVFRVEMGIPDTPEINLNFNPHEINLLNEVSFTKGCYIGQEVVARLDTYDKVQRKLCGVIFENGDNVLTGEVTDLEGENAGIITSVANSELLNKKIGLAVIRKKFLDKENFECLMNKKKLNLRIVTLPFER